MSVRRLPIGFRYHQDHYELYAFCTVCERPRWIRPGCSRCEYCRNRSSKSASKARLRGLVALTPLTLLAGYLGIVWAAERPILSFVSYLGGVAALYGVFHLLDRGC